MHNTSAPPFYALNLIAHSSAVPRTQTNIATASLVACLFLLCCVYTIVNTIKTLFSSSKYAAHTIFCLFALNGFLETDVSVWEHNVAHGSTVPQTQINISTASLDACLFLLCCVYTIVNTIYRSVLGWNCTPIALIEFCWISTSNFSTKLVGMCLAHHFSARTKNALHFWLRIWNRNEHGMF